MQHLLSQQVLLTTPTCLKTSCHIINLTIYNRRITTNPVSLLQRAFADLSIRIFLPVAPQAYYAVQITLGTKGKVKKGNHKDR